MDRSSEEQSQETDGHFVRLLRNERLPFAGFHEFRSAGVESRFTSDNIDATIAHLKERARMIAEKNPFVFGRLRTHRGAVSLWVPDKPDCDTFLRDVWVEGEDLNSGLSECFVEKCKIIRDKDEPVVRLCVVRSKAKSVKDFLLTVCVSHVIGEVTMIYSIWGMLNEGAEITTLINERIHNYRGHPLTGVKGAGKRKFLWFLLRSNASPFNHSKRAILNRDELVLHCCNINMDWVEEQKKKHDKSTTGAPFLSTQDIIVSWFFSQWETACVVVAYDMRNRAKGLTTKHMGNYLDVLVLYPEEYKNPANIRRAVQSEGRWEPRRNKPGSENPRSVGAITGWHSRYVDLNLPHAVRKNHLPLRSANGELPPLKDPPVMILFKTSPKQYAMWSLTTEEIKDKSALGPEIEF